MVKFNIKQMKEMIEERDMQIGVLKCNQTKYYIVIDYYGEAFAAGKTMKALCVDFQKAWNPKYRSTKNYPLVESSEWTLFICECLIQMHRHGHRAPINKISGLIARII